MNDYNSFFLSVATIKVLQKTLESFDLQFKTPINCLVFLGGYTLLGRPVQC